jgi:hypothetical protein
MEFEHRISIKTTGQNRVGVFVPNVTLGLGDFDHWEVTGAKIIKGDRRFEVTRVSEKGIEIEGNGAQDEKCFPLTIKLNARKK